MKIYLLLITVTLALTPVVYSQNDLSKLFDTKFSYEIENELKNNKLRESSASYYYTYIGEYEKALMTYEVPLAWGLDSLSHADSLAFKKYHPINAYDYLADRTKNEQIVIISEAHQKPQHRVFTLNLLESLYKNGFRYLGLETLTPNIVDSTQNLMDTLLNKRGYPLNNGITGYYTREPQMGNLVRKALDLGFELFAYEAMPRKEERDLQQAHNIEKFLAKHPNQKIVIHCGWYHAIESNYPKRRKDHYLAYHLKKLTGIDPLTIYQDALSEKYLYKESPYYHLTKANEVSILIDDNGHVFNGKEDAVHNFDILVYHPRTKYVNNRPNWLFGIKGNKFVEIEKGKIAVDKYPILAKAYLANEEYRTTPVDIIELDSFEEPEKLVLKKGVYRIVLIDKDGKEVEYVKEVK